MTDPALERIAAELEDLSAYAQRIVQQVRADFPECFGPQAGRHAGDGGACRCAGVPLENTYGVGTFDGVCIGWDVPCLESR